MAQVISVIQTVLPVILALGLGVLCRSRHFLSREGVDALKKVVLNICLPAVLLKAFMTAEYTDSNLVLPVLMFVLCCLALGMGMLLHRAGGRKGRLAPFLASGFEAGMLGYALFAVAFPQESSARFAILDLGQTLFVFTVYKLLLGGKGSGKTVVKDMVKTPVLWAVFVGVLLGVADLLIPIRQGGFYRIVTTAADFVAAPTAMIILLTVGYDLVPREIPWKKTAGLIGMRLFVMVLFLGILLALNHWVLDGIMFWGAAVLMCLLPPPYVVPVFADEPEERVEISAALSALTLISLVLFAVLCVAVGMGL